MSETDLSYISKSILNVIPDAVDLSREIKYSSYVNSMQYTEIFPSTQPPVTITSGNLGTSVRIIIADPSRWLKKRSATLQMDISVPTLNTGDMANFVVLDGPASMIGRVNLYIAGQQLNGGTINNFNKVACAIQMNEGSIASYCSDESALTGGCEKLKSCLLNTDSPTAGQLYASLADSPFNLIPKFDANGGHVNREVN